MSYFQRTTTKFPLPSGVLATLQPLSEYEWEEVLRQGRRDDGTTSSALVKAYTVLYALVEPKPESIDDVHNMPPDDINAADTEIAYLSGLLDRPEPPAPDTTGDEADGTEADPLVEEFPAARDDAVEAVVGEAGAVPRVPLPAGSGGADGSEAGDVPVHAGGREGAAGEGSPGDR